jgi:hypothetical protein
MTICVFAGPTLDSQQAHAIAPITLLPPAAVGDVYRAAMSGCTTLLLIDGYFRSVPSVQHKELLFALSRGIHVYGCSSMGAIRAAELADYGMVGIGGIFRAYRDGTCTDDDEVAVAHAGPEHGYRALSTPMVTIRHALALATRQHIVSTEAAATLTTIAKQLFYADRHWGTLLERGRAAGLAEGDMTALLAFVRTTRPDPKRADAVEALRSIDSTNSLTAPTVIFEPTYSWSMLIADETLTQEHAT